MNENIKAKASKELQNTIKEELEIPDPEISKAKAAINNNKGEDEDTKEPHGE